MSVVLVAHPSAEPSGHPVVPRFLRLLESGRDAHLVLIGRGAGRLERALPVGTRERLHAYARPIVSGEKPAWPRALLSGARGRHAGKGTTTPDSLLDELGAELVDLPCAAIAKTWTGWANGFTGMVMIGIGGDDLDGATLDGRPGYKLIWERADALYFESEAMAQLAYRLGAPEAKARVVPPVADFERVPEPRNEADADCFRILSVGPLSWTRGYEHALEGVRLLRESGINCRYRIVGSGDFADAVAFARYQLGLEDTVEILPLGKREELREQLAWADVFLNAAVTATSPRNVVDAQASRLPVVTTEVPPAGPGTALLVPARNPHAIADALALVATDQPLRHRLATKGGEATSSPWALTEQLDRFCQLYDALLPRVPE